MQTELFEQIASQPLKQKQVIKPVRKRLDFEQKTFDFDAPIFRDLTLAFQETYCGFGIYRKGDGWIAGHDAKVHASRAKARRSALRQARGIQTEALELPASQPVYGGEQPF